MRKYYDILDDAVGGGGNKLPDPPKNYNPLSVQQRADWNGFLDYANKTGTDFDKNPQAGAQLMAQYKKANPNFSITPDQIANIQYEQQQLRKGETFGNLKPEQLKYLRQGLPDTYLNRPLSDPNGQFNANTSKLYYPQKTANGKNYGTDVEGYVNGVGGQPVAPTPTAAPSVAPVTTAARPAGAIPLPDYDDPKSRAAYLDKFAPKYGNFVHNRGDSIIHVNEVPYGGTLTAKDSATKSATKLGLDPALLYSSSMEEGMSGLFPDKNGEITTADGEPPNKKYQVDGYFNYGLDNFGDQFKSMVAKGYLPKDFDYLPHPTKNEKGQKVNSAYFKTPEDAMDAKAAYVKMEQDNVDNYAKKNNIQLSDKARQFFTLVNFNGGSGDATHKGAGAKMMDYYAKKGLLKDDKFVDTPPEPGLGLGEYYEHVHPRVQMSELLKKEGLF